MQFKITGIVKQIRPAYLADIALEFCVESNHKGDQGVGYFLRLGLPKTHSDLNLLKQMSVGDEVIVAGHVVPVAWTDLAGKRFLSKDDKSIDIPYGYIEAIKLRQQAKPSNQASVNHNENTIDREEHVFPPLPFIFNGRAES